MAMHNGWALGAALRLSTLLAGCDSKPAATGAAAQGATPQGTISDELPDLNLLANDAPLADPADQPAVPAAGVAPVAPAEPTVPADPAPAPEAPAAGEDEADDSVAE